jgi:hypothetical protein
MHGTHRFGGRVVGNRHARIVAVQITVRAVGRGRAPCMGHHGTATIVGRGRTLPIGLYNLDVFQHCLAWGDYKLTLRFRVVFRKHGKVIGRRWCVRHARFFDTDPFHPPS